MAIFLDFVGGFLDSGREYIVYNSENNLVRYGYVDLDANTFTTIVTPTIAHAGQSVVATDGTFVFVADDTAGQVEQMAWNGSTITQRLLASTGANNLHNFCIRYNPEDAEILLSSNCNDFAHGIESFQYQTAPTYTFVEKDVKHELITDADSFGMLMDFRFTNPYTPNYGDMFVTVGNVSGNATYRSFTSSAGVITLTGSLTTTNYQNVTSWGWDRDSGLIVECPDALDTSVVMKQVNMSTKAITSIGTGTATDAVFACGASNGFVITVEDVGYIRSYTRAGSTLTQVSEIQPFADAVVNSTISVSPFSRRLYVCNGNVKSRVVSMDSAGNLTDTGPDLTNNISLLTTDLAFIGGTALPTV